MNRDAIWKTAVCRLEREDRLYVVESPLLDICSGVDEDPARAWEIFDDLLDAMYIEYLEGKKVGQYEKRGRPAKGGVVLSCSVKPDTKTSIEQLAKTLECSQGEAVDFLYAFFDAARTIPTPRASKSTKSTPPSIADLIVAEPKAAYSTARSSKSVLRQKTKKTIAKSK